MAAKTTNTAVTEAVAAVEGKKKNPPSIDTLEMRKQNLVHTYAEQPKHSVCLAPMYAPYFGNVMRVTINGISIAIPVNGQTFEVPETFAREINRRRVAIDQQLLRARIMSDVSNNMEESPGELSLF